jgi:hypothetical protein
LRAVSSLRPKTAWLLLAAVVLGFALAFWPGHMNADSLSMIDQASGDLPLTDHHSPLLVWVWSLGWPLGLRPGVILVLQVTGFLAGAYLVARASFGRLGASLVAIAVALSPPVFGNLGVISRDVWFLDSLLLAFGCLVLALRRPEHGRAALAASIVFALLCMFARQNAAAAVIVLAVVVASLLISNRLGGRRLLRPAAVGGAAVLGVVAALVLQLGATKAVGADPVHPEQYVYLYDLAGLSIRDGESHFPRDVYPSGDVGTLAAESSLDSIIPLSFGTDAAIPMPRTADQVAEMRDAWLDEVEDEPLEYLDWRWEAFEKQIGLTGPAVWVYHPVIDPNDDGYAIAFPALNDIAGGYQELFADRYLNGPTFQLAWFYLVLALCATVVLFVLPGTSRVVGALALSTWTYQVGLFFGTMGTQWRFEFPVAAISLITFAVAVKLAYDRIRAGRRREERDEPVSQPGEPAQPAAVPTGTASG